MTPNAVDLSHERRLNNVEVLGTVLVPCLIDMGLSKRRRRRPGDIE
jgi:hypothetical protein